jgi:uncharacterized membrane protein YczE
MVIVVLAVIAMGFSLSWLVLVDMGTDPCTSMNLAISARLGMSLGNWQALLNCILFIFVIFLGRENIGFGTLANMFLVGYSLDFFTWIWEKCGIPQYFTSMAVRVAVLFPALILFVFVASLYMDVQLGTSPYDAMSFIIAKYLPKVPFRIVRIAYDLLVIVIAWAFGAKIGIVTILMGFTLGPVITFVGKLLSRFIEVD